MSKLFPQATLRDRAPYRFDIVGSFLRPDSIKQARRQCVCGECSVEELHKVEDAEVAQLVAKEKAVGLPNVTDGEFRRTWWHLDFLFELVGVVNGHTLALYLDIFNVFQSLLALLGIFGGERD